MPALELAEFCAERDGLILRNRDAKRSQPLRSFVAFKPTVSKSLTILR